MKIITTVVYLAVVALLSGGTALAQEVKVARPQVIILKTDDMCATAPGKGPVISARWQKIIDFLEARKMRATIGIMGFSLEGDNQPYFDYLKELNKKGSIEFWNHGYMNRKASDPKGEFEGGSVEAQKASLEKTQKLAKEKLGIELKAFGPHWSGTDAITDKALEAIPEIKFRLFYAPKDPKASTKFTFERSVNLENPTFVPDFEKFKNIYEKSGLKKEYIVMQGHPNQWDDKRFAGFEAIIDYLTKKGCVFMTFSEYYESIKTVK